jgi:hypothetical protein
MIANILGDGSKGVGRLCDAIAGQAEAQLGEESLEASRRRLKAWTRCCTQHCCHARQFIQRPIVARLAQHRSRCLLAATQQRQQSIDRWFSDVLRKRARLRSSHCTGGG